MSRSRYLRNKRLRCNCPGYWFPHRVTGGACDYGPRRDYFIALRHGADEMTAMAEWAFDAPGKPGIGPTAEPNF